MQFGLNIFDRIIRKYLFIKGFVAGPLVDKQRVVDLIKTLQPWDTDLELIRLGPNKDGGYLVPNDLKNIEACFSPGVGNEIGFEKACLENNMKIYLADATVGEPDLNGTKFNFIKKNIGVISNNNNITIDDWINSSKLKKDSDLLLQMDIEGSEYEVLIETSIETLSRFRAIIIEFHGLNNLFEQFYLKVIASIFNKLGTHFSIAHCHPNNCCGEVKVENITVPRVLEITFIRNDRIKYVSEMNPFTLPHHLDEKNIKKNPDLIMPEIWWK